jgi:hypothetical protein
MNISSGSDIVIRYVSGVALGNCEVSLPFFDANLAVAP